MRSRSCTLIPREDKGRDGAWRYDRAIDVEILFTDEGERVWRLISNSSDGRYRFNQSEGVWSTTYADNNLYLINRGSNIILAMLINVPKDFFDQVSCGNSLYGDAEGLRSDVLMYYCLSFACV
jgi:hypothetical protein